MNRKDYLESFDLDIKDRIKYESRSHWMEIPNEDIELYVNEDAGVMYDWYRPNEDEEALLKRAVAYLTPRQRQVLGLYLQGLSQCAIADTLGLHQTTIHKTIYGNEVIHNGVPVTHGGVVKRLKKIVNKLRQENNGS